MSRPSVSNTPFAPLDGTLANDPSVYLPRLFVYFLQNLFRDFPPGCGMKWMPNEETTELVISAEKPKLETLEKLPSITCVLGAGQMNNMGFDQMQLMSFGQAWRRHTDLMAMTMSYHCQAKDGIMAHRVAWNAGYYTNVLRRILMRVGKLHHIAPNWGIGAESPATAYSGPTSNVEIVSVVVTIPFYWQPQWHITEPAELLKKMDATLKVNEVQPIYHASRVNALRPPRVMGRPVNTVPIGPAKVSFVQRVKISSPSEE